MILDELKRLIFTTVLSPGNLLYWGFLLAYLLVAVCLFSLSSSGRPNFNSLLRQLFPREIYGHASFCMDLKIFVVYQLMARVGAFAATMWVAAYCSEYAVSVLRHWADLTTELTNGPGIWDRLVFTVITIAVFDAGFFLAHFLSHKLPVLWAFHRVHHCAEHLTPLTAYRVHPVDELFSLFVGILLSSAAVSLFTLYHGTSVQGITVLNTSIILFCYRLLANFRHSHIWISYGPVFNQVFVSPCMHQIHHSSAERHMDKNFGFIFTFWDLLFRCSYIPEKNERFTLGLKGSSLSSDQPLSTHLLQPFVQAYNVVCTRLEKQSNKDS